MFSSLADLPVPKLTCTPPFADQTTATQTPHHWSAFCRPTCGLTEVGEILARPASGKAANGWWLTSLDATNPRCARTLFGQSHQWRLCSFSVLDEQEFSPRAVVGSETPETVEFAVFTGQEEGCLIFWTLCCHTVVVISKFLWEAVFLQIRYFSEKL